MTKNNIDGYGKVLQKLRKSKEMTQAELSEKTGIASNYISRIERGEIEPKISTLMNLKKALNVSGNELLGEMDNSLNGVLRKQFEKIQSFSSADIEFILTTIDLIESRSILRNASQKMSYEEYEVETMLKDRTEKRFEELNYLTKHNENL